jgi:hypothetical protein
MVCIDKYAASVWLVSSPTTVNKGLVAKIQKGRATALDLTSGRRRWSGRRIQERTMRWMTAIPVVPRSG